MSSLSDQIEACVRQVLTDLGESVSFVRTAEGIYNPIDGTTGTDTITNYTGFGSPSDYTAFEVTSLNVLQTDVKLTLEKTTTEPLKGDVATLSGVQYRVHTVSRDTINGVNVVFTLQLRK